MVVRYETEPSLDCPDGVKPRWWNYYRQAREANPNAIWLWDLERRDFGYPDPMPFDRRDLRGHFHLFAPTQSGKTSTVIFPASFNLIDMAAHQWRNPWLNTEPHRLPGLSLTIIDGKGGDHGLLNAVIWACELFGVPFKLWTNADLPTHVCNLFGQSWFQRFEPRQQAGILGSGAGVIGGYHVSQAFFDSQTMRVFTKMCEQRPRSFRFFLQYTTEAGRAALRKQGRPTFYSNYEWKETRAINAFLDCVATMLPLTLTRQDDAQLFDNQINLEDGFDTPCVRYFLVQDVGGADKYLAPAITGMLISSLGEIAAQRTNRDRPYLPQYVLVDDLPTCGSVLKAGLQKYAEYDVNFILSDQSIDSYPREDRDSIWAASRTKLFLNPVTHEERQTVMELSGEQLSTVPSYSDSVDHLGGRTYSESLHASYRPIIGINDVLAGGASQYHAFLHMRSDSTHGTERLEGRTAVVKLSHIITREKYVELICNHVRDHDFGPGSFLASEFRKKRRPGPAASGGKGQAKSIKEAFEQTTLWD